MFKVKSYAGFSADTPLKYYEFERRALRADDVQIKILYCGVCHSDIHSVRNEWQGAVYPLVPGHEIVGKVEKVGSGVTCYQPGDVVGVGCMVGSCGECSECHADLEQFCSRGTIFTYNSVDIDDDITKGGYSDRIVVKEKFVLQIPPDLDLAEVAPLLCAGITTYSPLKHWGIGNNDKVGIIGLGGLGHMAVKFARAMGAHVVVLTTSEHKKTDALRLGAHEVILSTRPEELVQHHASFDFILDTVAAPHSLDHYIDLLKPEKTLCMVGLPSDPIQVSPFGLVQGRKRISGSLIGGIAETQEMLDYCGKHQITSEIELISIQFINEAYTRILSGDVKYRFVIDMNSLNKT